MSLCYIDVATKESLCPCLSILKKTTYNVAIDEKKTGIKPVKLRPNGISHIGSSCLELNRLLSSKAAKEGEK